MDQLEMLVLAQIRCYTFAANFVFEKMLMCLLTQEKTVYIVCFQVTKSRRFVQFIYKN